MLLILSVLAAFGIAISIVEKGDEWPIIHFKEPLKKFLTRISPNLAKVVECSVCLSFWTTLLTDILICFFTRGEYFAWPLSGFVTIGFTWIVYSILNSLDPPDAENGV